MCLCCAQTLDLKLELRIFGRMLVSEKEKGIHAETLQWLESLPVTDDRWLDSCPEAKASFEKHQAGLVPEVRNAIAAQCAEYKSR